MSLSSISLRRPILATVMSVIIVTFGIIGFQFLGVREYPSVDPPIISVTTNYTGANADVIESQITEPLERTINGIEGIRSIISSSNQGSSKISVEFDLSTDLEAAANDVRDKVSRAIRQLPEDIDAPPTVSKADADAQAIISMTVKSNTRNQLEVCDYAINVLQERLQTISGVSGIQVWGEKKYAMRIWIDPLKLAANKLTLGDIKTALDKQNIELPSGKIAGNATELTVKTSGLLVTEEDFNNLIVKSGDGQIIRLQDVAHAVLGPENEETVLKESGVPMVALALTPQPGSNHVAIADEFYKRYEQLKKEVPDDIQLDIAMDTTKFVRQSIVEVQETLLIAILLVVIIIYLFFRNWLIAFRPLIDIPVSLLGAFFIMYIFGFSINVLTLLGIVLATGLVVDDGIVVTENIFKKLEQGKTPMQAAREGSEEIFFAVISTSITLAVVFLPIIFIQGFVGRLFQEFGIVVAGAVVISAFVSLTLTPVLSVKLAGNPEKKSWFYRKTEPFYAGMDNGYKRTLEAFMAQRWIAGVLIIACVALVVILNKTLKQELAPMEDRGLVRLTMLAPEGTSYDYMDSYMDNIAHFINDSIPEKKVLLTVTAPGFLGSGAPNTGFGRVVLGERNTRKRSQQEIADYINKNSARFNAGRVFVIQEPTISSGGGGRGLDVQFVLQNSNFEKIKEYLPKFLEEASKHPTFGGIVNSDLKFNRPELGVTINRAKAAELGVSVADIAQTLQLALSGRRLGYFIMLGKQYQVIGQVDRGNRDEPVDMRSFYVRSSTGELIQLDNLVSVEEQSNPPQLFHYNRYKSATVQAGLAPGKTIGDGVKAMQEIADKVLDETFTTSLSGASRDFQESSSNTLFAFALALFLVYLVLAAQFESFRDPFIIMVTVPLALAGALLSLWIFGQTNNIFSQIGAIMLIGLVTKNGILIVEFANQLREKDPELSRRDAAVQAATMRLRPILMTSLATALGALPIALALGSGAQSRIPLGIVIIGGVIFSLVLTLFVIPAIYTMSLKQLLRYLKISRLVRFFGVPAAILLGSVAVAQNPLTLNEAVEIALKNNYDIQLAKNAADITAINNNAGNAGMLPNVDFNVSENLSNTDINQKFSSGLELQRNGVGATNLNANVALSWTLFDGMKMFATKHRLEELEAQSGFALKEQIQQTVAQIMVEYYAMVGQKMQIKATQKALDLVQKRLEVVKTQYEVGTVSAFELNQVTIDQNTNQTNLLLQQNTLKNQMAGFNILLARETDIVFDVIADIDVDTAQAATIDKDLGNKNFSLLSAERSVSIAGFQLSEARSTRMPIIRLNSSYAYTRQSSQAGFALLNQSNGLNAGVTASVPLFRGGTIKNQIKTSQLQLRSSQLQYSRLKNSISYQYQQAYNNFVAYKSIVGMEENNAALALKNLTIAEGRLKQGLSTLIEVKEADRDWQDAESRLIEARYNFKVAQIQLQQLRGELVK